jgi:carbon monoxide dehydrogenase subunit G
VRISGRHAFEASPARVFEAICDPRTLMDVIPGCRDVVLVGPATYAGHISLRLPGSAGVYRTEVQLVEVREPEHAVMRGRLEGSMGSIAGEATFDLAVDGAGTLLDYSGSAAIQGPLARLDSRFVEGLAKSLIGQGLTALDERLSAEVVA